MFIFMCMFICLPIIIIHRLSVKCNNFFHIFSYTVYKHNKKALPLFRRCLFTLSLIVGTYLVATYHAILLPNVAMANIAAIIYILIFSLFSRSLSLSATHKGTCLFIYTPPFLSAIAAGSYINAHICLIFPFLALRVYIYAFYPKMPYMVKI